MSMLNWKLKHLLKQGLFHVQTIFSLTENLCRRSVGVNLPCYGIHLKVHWSIMTFKQYLKYTPLWFWKIELRFHSAFLWWLWIQKWETFSHQYLVITEHQVPKQSHTIRKKTWDNDCIQIGMFDALIQFGNDIIWVFWKVAPPMCKWRQLQVTSLTLLPAYILMVDLESSW